LSWTSEEVDQKLKEIMLNIHSSVKYGSDSNGYVDYVKGKYCWFLKWLTLCLLKEEFFLIN
jgi:glutamate dehydrogenase/leucine dehydrogenase